MSTVKQILRLHFQGKGKKYIARVTGVSRNTVRRYLSLSEECDFSQNRLLGLNDEALEKLFNPMDESPRSDRFKRFSDQIDYLLKELSRAHVTRKLLWLEYKKQDPEGYEYSQFCHHLLQAKKARNAGMVIPHEVGDLLYIDFAGKTWEVYDGEDGQPTKKQIFVACLGYSQYAYVEAVESQTTEDFIAVLNRCLVFYSGVSKGIVPDNLKAAVIKADRYEPDLNRVLEDFANHFGTAIIPARSAKPQDKSLAENLVKHSYYQIRGPLRNRKFFDLPSLNEAIWEQLAVYNEKPFQRRNYSRYDLFNDQEKSTLSPLPVELFQIKKYRRLTVQKNSHILLSEDHHYYSVPYAYIGKRVRVIYTHSLVNVYCQAEQITSHARNKRPYAYTTVPDHLPSHFQDYLDRSPDYYLSWAATKGPDTLQLIEKILEQRKHPEQAYRSCEGIKHLGHKVDHQVFMKACRIAVEYGCYQYKFIKTLIENGMTDQVLELSQNTNSIPDHENIRGKSHYQNHST